MNRTLYISVCDSVHIDDKVSTNIVLHDDILTYMNYSVQEIRTETESIASLAVVQKTTREKVENHKLFYANVGAVCPAFFYVKLRRIYVHSTNY
jgi:hypothetical protein